MASQADTLVTGSWDTYIRLWDLNSGDLSVYSEIKYACFMNKIMALHYISLAQLCDCTHVWPGSIVTAFMEQHRKGCDTACIFSHFPEIFT